LPNYKQQNIFLLSDSIISISWSLIKLLFYHCHNGHIRDHLKSYKITMVAVITTAAAALTTSAAPVTITLTLHQHHLGPLALKNVADIIKDNCT
jgi:hypothetical protein